MRSAPWLPADSDTVPGGLAGSALAVLVALIVVEPARLPTTRFCIVICSMSANRQKNMRFKEAANTPLMPFEAYLRTCFNPAKVKLMKLKRIVR